MRCNPDSQPARSRGWRTRALLIAGALTVVLTPLVLMIGRSNDQEVDRLIGLLQPRDRSQLAEIGAGTGWFDR